MYMTRQSQASRCESELQTVGGSICKEFPYFREGTDCLSIRSSLCTGAGASQYLPGAVPRERHTLLSRVGEDLGQQVSYMLEMSRHMVGMERMLSSKYLVWVRVGLCAARRTCLSLQSLDVVDL